MNKRSLFAALVATLTFMPIASWAHVKWFVDQPTLDIEPFKINEPAVMIWTAAFIAALIIAYVLQRKLQAPEWLVLFGKRYKESILWTVHFLIGLWLIINSFTGALFVPTLELSAGLEPLLWLQGIAGGLIVARRYARLSALLLVILYISASLSLSWLGMTEHLFILGIALWLIISNEGHPANDWAITALRITAGLSLILLGFQEKLIDPSLSATFLSTHEWNFMTALGMEWFNDRLFILSAGMTEILIGVIYLVGFITRINTLALAVVLLSTAALLGINELIGHLPIFAMAILFLVYGSGQRAVIGKRR